MHSTIEYVLACVRSKFREYVVRNRIELEKCSTPWLTSLFQIVNHTATDVRPCNDSESTEQTFLLSNFFNQLVALMDEQHCSGIKIFTNVLVHLHRMIMFDC